MRGRTRKRATADNPAHRLRDCSKDSGGDALKNKWIITVLAAGFLAGSGAMSASPYQAADNTKANKTESKGATADQGKNNAADRALMQKIRQSIVADKSLSTYAHNTKVIAQGGKVTLKGPVRSEAEKQSIEQKATEIAGAGNVTNEITIQPAKPKKGTN
jgi:osmotically-inducible protein OsmY